MYTCFRLWSTQLNVGPVLHVLGSEDTKCLSRWKWVGKPKAKVEIWSFSLKWNPISFLKTKPEIHKKSSKIWQNGKGSNALNFCCTKSRFDKPIPDLVHEIQIWYTKFKFQSYIIRRTISILGPWLPWEKRKFILFKGCQFMP